MSKSTYRNLVTIPGSDTDNVSDGETIGGDIVANFKKLANFANGFGTFLGCGYHVNNYAIVGMCTSSIGVPFTSSGDYLPGSWLIQYTFLSGNYWQTGNLFLRNNCAGWTVTGHSVTDGNMAAANITLEFSVNSNSTLTCNSTTMFSALALLHITGVGVLDNGNFASN